MVSALIRCNFIIKDYVNRKITSYIYLLIFTISLWLMIEKGRHRKIDLENRLCPLCKFEVRDELHFIIKCTKLQELRNKFYQKISDILPSFYNLSDTEKFHLIFRDISYFMVYLKLCYLELRQHPLTHPSKTASTHTPQ